MITFQKWPKCDSKLHLVDHEVESATPKLATKGSFLPKRSEIKLCTQH